VRKTLKKIPGLKSTWYLAIALKQMIGDQWRNPSSYDSIFEETQDPWESTTSPSEAERFAVTFSVLDAAGVNRFDSAVELGCAEGIFTERIAPRCDHIDALDFSEVALERARKRLIGHSGITFRRWDMRHDPLVGSYDLVIAMGVLTSLYRPADVRRMAASVVKAIKPGGYLLYSDHRQALMFETAWWGGLVLRGGEQIRRLLSKTPELETLRSAETSGHVYALYRRVG
jgi:2-polyprenyl-3-methyl-5-hydroxy-6-metoxy-1,4-benzoquinol methylase